jgi:quercetin dioxygenase-like cupin family protein
MKYLTVLPLLAGLALAPCPVLALEGSDVIKSTPVLKTQQTWYGQDIAYPGGKAEVSGVVIELAPGGATGWHQHPVPSLGYVIEGELEVHFRNGDVKRLRAGESAAEAVNVMHNGVNAGDVPAKLVIFYLGTPGIPLTVREGEE